MQKPIQFVDLKKQYENIKSDIDQAIQQVIDNTQFIGGPDVKKFEENFAKFCDSKFCIAVGSGHSALELIFEALDLQEGDEVIVPTNSYISTALAPSYAGAKVVLVDCHIDYFTIDVNEIEKAITPKTKVIAVTHLYGQPAQMDTIVSLANKYNLQIVEDVAQAHGAKWRGTRVGNFGIAGAYSFYPGKNLGAYGDAGAITTNDAVFATKVRYLAEYGQSKKYVHVSKGHNSRLDTIQAAILNVKLPYLQNWLDTRLEIAKYYNEKLKDLPIRVPVINPDGTHVFHVYCIVTEKRDALLTYLKENNIHGNIHYPTPIHLQGAYKELGYKKGDFPAAEFLADRILSLPMYPELSFEEVNRIITVIKNFYASH